MVVRLHLLLLVRVSFFPDDPRVTSPPRTVLRTRQVKPVGHRGNLRLYVEAVNRRVLSRYPCVPVLSRLMV